MSQDAPRIGMLPRLRALRLAMKLALGILLAAACSRPPAPSTTATPHGSPAAARAPVPATSHRAPITLTYLGVAGWQIDAGAVTILADPYFSRPELDGRIVPDELAIARRSPARADLIVVGHSHVDHLLDVPSVARRTGAQILGSLSTARIARATGVPVDQIIPIQGGEDYAFPAGYSVRVLRSLHSALGKKHIAGGAEIAANPRLPLSFDDYAEGGAFAYLVRLGGHEVFLLSTANFIEREIEGLRPDIAIVATGLRQEIHDYTCRLMRALGNPPLVYTNHFDDWRAPPVDAPPDDDLHAFIAEVERCSPGTKVVVPKHFEAMTVR
jgi:L-ascorbate metabolism protein UlaG (beta-lactamase superfamily)